MSRPLRIEVSGITFPLAANGEYTWDGTSQYEHDAENYRILYVTTQWELIPKDAGGPQFFQSIGTNTADVLPTAWVEDSGSGTLTWVSLDAKGGFVITPDMMDAMGMTEEE